jgi:hypothetical protein
MHPMLNQSSMCGSLLRAIAVLSAISLLLTACDSTGPVALTGDVFVQGIVTSDAGFAGKNAGAFTSIDGAVVTAAEVGATGQLMPLTGQTTSASERGYLLTTQPTWNPVMVQAEKDGLRVASLIESGVASGPVPGGVMVAPPMTAESTAAADALARGRRHSEYVFVADATAFVSARTAAALKTGHITTDMVGNALAMITGVETAFARRPGGGNVSDAVVPDVRAQRRVAYAEFRHEIAAAQSGEARTAAVDSFLDAYGSAFANHGISPTRQALISLATYGTAKRFAGVTFAEAVMATAHRALSFAALNTALAIEREFEVAGAPIARLSTLSQARANLMTAIAEGATAQAIEAALSAYRGVVRLELAGELNVSLSSVDIALQAVSTIRNSLNSTLASTTSPDVVADAYVTFFNSSNQAVRAQLGANGQLAANVMPMIGAF